MALKNRINLSKIPVKETASKTIKVDFNDGDGLQEYRIHALDDSQRQCIGVLYANDGDVLKARKLYTILLACGFDAIDGDQYAANYLLKNANEQAMFIGNEIYQLTMDFYAEKDKEAVEAEKNSVTAPVEEKEQNVTEAVKEETKEQSVKEEESQETEETSTADTAKG